MYNKPIQLSPNSLNLYLECPCCFWLEKREGIKRPPPYPYALNSAVDTLLKEEFDKHRAKNEVHPLIAKLGPSVKLFANQDLLNQWRSNFSGIRYYDEELDATLFGAVDDVLEFNDPPSSSPSPEATDEQRKTSARQVGKLAPLDYKSTGSKVANVYDRFQIQMDIYNYLLEKNGFKTTRKGYLAFYIVDKENGFIDRLPFRKELHTIETNPDDVYPLFKEAVMLLRKDIPPLHNPDCKFGAWFKQSSKFHGV